MDSDKKQIDDFVSLVVQARLIQLETNPFFEHWSTASSVLWTLATWRQNELFLLYCFDDIRNCRQVFMHLINLPESQEKEKMFLST